MSATWWPCATASRTASRLSLRETGKVLGLSGERVRLIEREALRKLRDSNLINAVALG